MNADRIIESGKNTIFTERDALNETGKRIDKNFVKAVELILACKGRVIITGMGKSGHIAKKIAATLSSTGTPSFFLHPAEGIHGDLGMLVKGDVVIALSNSGETEEIKNILPVIKRLQVPLISITGNVKSTLGLKSDATLDAYVEREACPMNLAPTSSTTVSMALGDALAVALVVERGFKASDFALVHPAGALGKKLLLKVGDIWHTGNELPVVKLSTSMKDLLYTISSKGFGCAAVIDDNGKMTGIVTDGDLRRAMEKFENIANANIQEIMSKNPKLINKDDLAASAMALFEKYSITSAFVVNEHGKPEGLVHIHDLTKAGLS